MVDYMPPIVQTASRRAVSTAVPKPSLPVVDAKSRAAAVVSPVSMVEQMAVPCISVKSRSIRSVSSVMEFKHLPGIHDQETHTTDANQMHTGPVIMSNTSRVRSTANRQSKPGNSRALTSVGAVARRRGQDDSRVNATPEVSLLQTEDQSGPLKVVRAFGRRRTVQYNLPRAQAVLIPQGNLSEIGASVTEHAAPKDKLNPTEAVGKPVQPHFNAALEAMRRQQAGKRPNLTVTMTPPKTTIVRAKPPKPVRATPKKKKPKQKPKTPDFTEGNYAGPGMT